MIETQVQVDDFFITGTYTPTDTLDGWSPKRSLHELATIDEEDVVYATSTAFAAILRKAPRTSPPLGSGGTVRMNTQYGIITIKLFVE